MSRRLWIVMRLRRWDELATTFPDGSPTPMTFAAPGDCVGFLPAYASSEAALRDHPGATLAEVAPASETPSMTPVAAE